MFRRVGPWATLLAAALGVAVPARSAEAEAPDAPRRKVAVLEYRGGVDNAPDLANAIAAHLKRTAALDIVDLREARRRNPSVDAEVARCTGEAACMAKAGRKIGVDEVLLVAMSQLGDLVINLQRIDLSTGRAAGAPLSTVLTSNTIDPDKLDEWLRRLYPPALFKLFGRITITANIEGALVKLNDKVMGETPLDKPLRVEAPKSYKVNLTREGRVPFAARIDVVPDATVEVNAELPELQQATPWYKRWYPWAILGAVVAGGAVGTALWVTRPDEANASGFVTLP